MLKAKDVSPKVFICTLVPVEKAKPLGDAYFDTKKINDVNRIIETEANNLNVNIIDLNNAFASHPKETYTTDGVHPNKIGYDIIRRKLASEISKRGKL